MLLAKRTTQCFFHDSPLGCAFDLDVLFAMVLVGVPCRSLFLVPGSLFLVAAARSFLFVYGSVPCRLGDSWLVQSVALAASDDKAVSVMDGVAFADNIGTGRRVAVKPRHKRCPCTWTTAR